MSQHVKHERIQSPLARARGLGAAHHAVGHWVNQRITAIANIPLMLWLVSSIVHLRGVDYTTFTVWLAQPLNAILMILVIVSTFYHAALGTQVIVEDYVHNKGMKIFKLVMLRLFFIGAGVACVFSILKIAFTAGV
jgi:succinate dehydrogenase / fumarate reductase membrane anchor subunit